MVLDIFVGSRGPRLHRSSAPDDQEIHYCREGTWRTDQFGKARSCTQSIFQYPVCSQFGQDNEH